MESHEIDALVKRLVANPHDQEALTYAHQAGASDPKAYALLLESVGRATPDPAYASHWLSEAANVWSVTLGDQHRAASVLMQAIDKDPTQEVAAERLAQLYREKGEQRSLIALLERRSKALMPLLGQRPELRQTLGALFEELGRLWAEPPLGQTRKALDSFRRALEVDPQRPFAVYALRELYKQQNMFAEALPLFEAEQQLIEDPARKVALYRDEASVRLSAGDGAGATQAMRGACAIAGDDPSVLQDLATTVVERVKAGYVVGDAEREEAASIFVALAEAYGGEHGLVYSHAALDLRPGHDRAMQLAAFFGKGLGRTAELPDRWSAYLAANPEGPLAEEARSDLAAGGRAPVTSGSVAGPPPASAGARGGWDGPQGERPEGIASEGGEVRSRPSLPEGGVEPMLHAAADAAAKGNRAAAFAKYEEALRYEPANTEALAWVKDHLRQKRKYAELRDALVNASRATTNPDERKQLLREVAALCEQQLRDVEGAVQALRQLAALDRGDPSVGESLRRLLERSARWDDLASVLEEEAMLAPDLEGKLALEKKLAQLHETRRKDPLGAAEAWGRIANLTPDDDQAIWTSVKLYEKAGRPELAAQTIGDAAHGVDDAGARGALLVKLGELREKLGEHGAAGEAYADAADLTSAPKTWDAAVRAHSTAERWGDAARALEARAALLDEPKAKAQTLAKAAELHDRAADPASATARYEEAIDLDPANDSLATALEARYLEGGNFVDLASLLTTRADRLSDRERRVALRKRAAEFQRERLEDPDAARETLVKVLEDGDDAEALSALADDAEVRGEYADAASLLRRLFSVTHEKAGKLAVALREANLLSEHLDDTEAAAARYESVLADLDPHDRDALAALADLEERRERHGESARALETLATLVAGDERTEIARRLAAIYEGPLTDDRGAARALEIVAAADPEDFDALTRLRAVSERLEDWPRVVELLRRQVEVEVDEEEVSQMTRRLAEVLDEKLDQGDQALAALEGPADAGDEACRDAYIALGDKRGWQGIVAAKLVMWHENSAASPERAAALRGAFERFVGIGRDADAARVGLELARAKHVEHDLGPRLEDIAVRLRDLDALQVAHDLRSRELAGAERAEERVRQAEVLRSAGVESAEAVQHGEEGLGGVPIGDVEPLLARLALVAGDADSAVDLYERQASRARAPVDKLRALSRAAQVAAAHGSPDRARGFFELALAGGGPGVGDDTLSTLETAAREGDAATKLARPTARGIPVLEAPASSLDEGTGRGATHSALEIGNSDGHQDESRTSGETAPEVDLWSRKTSEGEPPASSPAAPLSLRRLLAEAMAAGGQGYRDGGRTRSALLRRAASLAARELDDHDRAFHWLGDAIVAHVDAASLDALDALGEELGDLARVEATLSRALTEVFDGPLVRQLVARRARLRKDRLDDKVGAAQDLRKLHDLTPSDQAVMEELTQLFTELGDYRGMVQMLEDQILRGKDPNARSELARRVARLWEEKLNDPREAADAWRRVLRMKAGDAEGQAGLDRAKVAMAKRGDDVGRASEAPLSSRAGSVSSRPSAIPPSSRPGSIPPSAGRGASGPPASLGRGSVPPPSLSALRPSQAPPAPLSGPPALPTPPSDPARQAVDALPARDIEHPPMAASSPAEPDPASDVSRASPFAESARDRPARPDISFRRRDDEPTILTPIEQRLVRSSAMPDAPVIVDDEHTAFSPRQEAPDHSAESAGAMPNFADEPTRASEGLGRHGEHAHDLDDAASVDDDEIFEVADEKTIPGDLGQGRGITTKP